MKNTFLYFLILFSALQAYSQNIPNKYIFEFDDKSIIQYYDAKLKQKQLSNFELKEETFLLNYTQASANAQNKINGITGELTFQFNGQWYDGIIVNTDSSQVRMHWLYNQNGVDVPYKNTLNIKHELELNDYKVLMLTNGGMYLENNFPQGLFVHNGKTLRAIDLDSNKYGNFYMKPNGVFYIDNTGKCNIATTNSYTLNNYKNIAFATQSGPMLVINGKIHQRFNHQSKNLYLRSGVGILSENKVVFIISRSNQTNFHDFAVIFKDIIGCNNALYLDGAISRMYLEKLRPNDLGGDFGVIISAIEKK